MRSNSKLPRCRSSLEEGTYVHNAHQDMTLENTPSLSCTGLDRTAMLRFGLELGRLCAPGDCLLLHGDLGSGKTTLTGAIARGVGVAEDQYVTSPSFTLLHEYDGKIPLYHLDLYRLNSSEEVEDAGLLEYVEGAGVAVVEWPQRLGYLTPRDHLEITITITDPDHRDLALRPVGQIWADRLGQLRILCSPWLNHGL